jgi:hypothetical protein
MSILVSYFGNVEQSMQPRPRRAFCLPVASEMAVALIRLANLERFTLH